MTLATTADLLVRARAHRVGLPAFNVTTLEHAKAIAEGAEMAGLPAIVQISENAVKFHRSRPAPIAAGMVKITIGTILNLSWTSAIREVLDAQPTVVDPRIYLRPARERVAAVVARLTTVIGGPS